MGSMLQCVVAGGLLGLAGCQPSLTGSAGVEPPGAVQSGIGDFDNDKDIDLYGLTTAKGALEIFLDGDAGADVTLTGLSNAVYVAFEHFTNANNTGIDNYVDLVVLSLDKKAGECSLQLWKNLGAADDGSGVLEWQGFAKIGSAHEVKYPFDLVWGGAFHDNSGRGVVLFSTEFQKYFGVRFTYDASSGAFTGFEDDSKRRDLPDGEALESVTSHVGGMAFLLRNAKNELKIRRYTFGNDLQ